MFERMEERVRRSAGAIARARAQRAAEQLNGELPQGLSAEAQEDGVRLVGRGLFRRLALDPVLRALLARLG